MDKNLGENRRYACRYNRWW